MEELLGQRMEDRMFLILPDKKVFVEKKRNSFRQTQLLGPFIFLGLNFLFIYSLKLELRSFVLLYSLLSSFTTAFCVLIATNALGKLNKIVLNISFKLEELSIETRLDTIVLPINSNSFTTQVITLLGQDYKALVVTNDGNSYNLILDFFEHDLKEFLIKKQLI